MKLRFFALALTLCSIGVSAAGITSLLLIHKDGTKVVFDFTEKLTISYPNDSIVMTTPSYEIAYKLSDIGMFDLVDHATSVARRPSGTPQMVSDDGVVVISNAPANTPVCIYTPGGETVARYTVGQNGELRISLRQLAKGTYIVKSSFAATKYTLR